jgi:hypothetical protein
MTPFIKVKIMPEILLLIGTVYWGRSRNRCPQSNALAEWKFLFIKIGDPGKQHQHNAKHWVINKLVNRPILSAPSETISSSDTRAFIPGLSNGCCVRGFLIQ